MTTLRAILDRINDVEASMARIAAEATGESALAYRLTLESLETRRDELREELFEITKREFVEVCDYRIIPEREGAYALSGVTTALHEFQDILSVVFDAQTTKPKQKLVLDAESVSKTRLNFGFAYSGSLGVALTIRNDQLLLFGSDLDRAIDAVFAMLKPKSADAIKTTERNFGPPAVRKLYNWSKAHRDHGMSADIKWIRGKETMRSVVAQPQEFAEICRIIEAEGRDDVQPITLTGTLASWNTVARTFILQMPDADLLRGTISKNFSTAQPRTVHGPLYEASLLKHTIVKYTSEKDEVLWELIDIREAN